MRDESFPSNELIDSESHVKQLAERYQHSTGDPVHSPHDGPASALSILELVTGQIGAAVTRCSRDLRCLWANHEYSHWVQRPLDQIIGWPIADVLGADASARLWTHVERVLQGDTVRYEEEVLFQGIGRRWIAATYTPTVDSNHIVDGWVSVMIDTTSRKHIEQALRDSVAEAEALKTLHQSVSKLWAIQDIDVGLQEILASAVRLMGADKGNVQRLDPDRGVLTIAVQRGFDQPFLDFFREVSVADPSACGRALLSAERVIVEDVERELSFAPLRDIAKKSGFRAVVSTPLIGIHGHLLGILSTHFRESHRPTDAVLAKLELYARRAAAFIERCEAEQAVIRAERQKHELASDLTLAEQHTREQLAKVLHDDLQQLLLSACLKTDRLAHRIVASGSPEADANARELARVSAILSKGNDIVRSLSRELFPPVLMDGNVLGAMQWLAGRMREQFGLTVTLSVDPNAAVDDKSMRVMLFESVRELLFNAVKHAKVDDVQLDVAHRTDGALQITVVDGGTGFDPDTALGNAYKPTKGSGLSRMRERLALLGGQLEIASTPGHGTRCVLIVPKLSAVADQIPGPVLSRS